MALADREPPVRRMAAWALGSLDADVAITALIDALKDQDKEVRISAADALGNIGPEAKEALPPLIAALKDQNEMVRGQAAEALGKIATALFDTKSTDTLPQLRAAYEAMKDHPDQEVAQNAAPVKRTRDYFESLWWVGARERAVEVIKAYPLISAIVATYLLLQLIWLLLFWLRPLLLLKVMTSLSQTGEKYTIPSSTFPCRLKPLKADGE